jgi:hypothetical protein
MPFVDRYKPKLKTFEEMYALLRKDPERRHTLEDAMKLWGYPPEVENAAVRKHISDFNKWLERERGLIWQSTVNYCLYSADEVRDYRRGR